MKFMYFLAAMLEIVGGCAIFMFIISLLILVLAGR